MITFACAHCENEFTVPDEYAGRDGWCRVCKRFLIIPTLDGSGVLWEDMPLAKKCGRLDKMVQFAARRIDELKTKLALYRDENGQLLPAETLKFRNEARVAFAAKLDHARRQSDKLRAELADLRSVTQADSRGEVDSSSSLEAFVQLAGEMADNSVPEAESAAIEELEAARAELADLRHALDEARSSHEDMEKESDHLRQQVEKLEGDLQEAEERGATLEGLKQELEEAKKSLSEATAEKERLRADAGGDSELLESAQHELREKITVLEEALAGKEALATDLDRALHDLEALRQEFVDAKEVLEGSQRAEAEIRDEIGRLISEKDLSADSQRLAEEDLRQEIDTLTQATASRGEIEAELGKTLEELKAAQDGMAQVAAARSEVEAELEKLRSQLAKQEDTPLIDPAVLEEAHSKVASLESAVAELRAEQTDAASSRKGVEGEIQALSVSLDETRQSLAGVVAQRDGTVQELETLRSEFDTATQTNDDLLAQRTALNTELKALSRALETASKSGREAEEATESLRHELACVNETMALAETAGETLAQERDQLAANLEAARKEHRSAVQDLEDAEAKKDTANVEVERLNALMDSATDGAQPLGPQERDFLEQFMTPQDPFSRTGTPDGIPAPNTLETSGSGESDAQQEADGDDESNEEPNFGHARFNLSREVRPGTITPEVMEDSRFRPGDPIVDSYLRFLSSGKKKLNPDKERE